MKKILSFLLIIVGLYGYSQDEYYRTIDWKFYPENVIQLTDSTYLTDAYPFDYNDVGAIQRVVGNYVVDFVGHRYSVIDSTSTTITVLDIYHTGQAPQTSQIARCYRSVKKDGSNISKFIGSVDYSPLDESARWKLNGADNYLLWNQLADPRDTIQFSYDKGAPSFSPYKMFVDTTNHTIAFYNDEEHVAMQVGQEMWSRIYNNGLVTIANGTVVRITGSFSGIATVDLASNDLHTDADGVLGVMTHDVESNTYGFVTTMGEVHELNTALCPEGGIIYLGANGTYTHVRPLAPNFVIEIGTCLYSHVTDGTILVNIKGSPYDIVHSSFNDIFIESMKFTVTSDGTNITGNLERNGGGDLTMQFSDGFTTLDCTPIKTIALTQGTTTTPQTNYVYALKSTKNIEVSTSGWPSDEHIKIAQVACRTAALTMSDGVLRNQNWNDHIAGSNGSGHISHINERIRRLNADYYSGIDQTVTVVSASDPDNVYLSTTGGKVYQMHLQDFPAISLPTEDIHVVNHYTTPYLTTTNLNSLLTDAINGTLVNRSFSFVVWGVQNESGERSHLMLNLPIGSYSSGDDAKKDANNYSVYSIPDKFKGVGFLICRITFSHSPSGSGTWTLDQVQDLRGFYPNNTAGSGSSGIGGGVDTYLELTDTPNSYASSANKLQGVNSAETAIESKAMTVTLAGTANIPTGQQYQINGGSIIVDAINNGVTTTAPSQNSVFNALALKEPTLTKGNLTAGSSKVTIGGTGTNALIGTGASIDVNEANIVHQNISGSGTNTHAQIDNHITNDGDLSSTNEIQDLSLSGNTLSLSGDASTVDLSGYAPASGSANYVQVSPPSPQIGNIWMNGGATFLSDVAAKTAQLTSIQFIPIIAPSSPTIGSITAGGSVDDGSNYYRITFVTALGETDFGTISSVAVTSLGNNTVNLTNIPISSDTAVIYRKIYRGSENSPYYRHVATILDNITTTYSDTISNSSLVTRGSQNLWNTTAGKIYVGNTLAGYIGVSNTILGLNSFSVNTTGFDNTSVGWGALSSNTTGYNNQAFGVFSLFNNTTGVDNSGFGVHTLQSNTTGIGNTAIGEASLEFNVDGSNNTAGGKVSLINNVSGSFNTGFGFEALYSNMTGSNNTAIGTNSLFYNVGGNNTAIGMFSGQTITTGSNNTFIGYGADAASNSISNSIGIGYNSVTSKSNQAVIGNISTTETLLNGKVGINTDTPLKQLSVGRVGVGYFDGVDGDVLLSCAKSSIGMGSSLMWNMNVGGGYSNSALAKIQPDIYNPDRGYKNNLDFYVGTWNNNDNVGLPKLSINDDGAVEAYGSFDAPIYKLSGVDLFSSLTIGSRTKWDGTKLVDDTDTFAPAFSGTENYIPKFGVGGTTIENSNIKYYQKSLNIGINPRGWSSKNALVFGDESSLPTYPFIYSQNSQLLHIGGNAYFDGTDWRYQFELAPITAYDMEIAYNGITIRRAIIGSADNIINWVDVAKFNDIGNIGLGYSTGTEIDNHKLAVNGNTFFNGFANATAYKLSGVDLYSSLTANTLQKWDGAKHVSVSNASGYLYNDGSGNMSWIKTVPQSLSGTTPTLNASNGVNANLSISGATTLTLSNLISGTSGTIYLTNNASVYRIKIAGYTIAPASNITYDSTGILLPASSVWAHTSIGWYYNGTTVQIHKADYNSITY